MAVFMLRYNQLHKKERSLMIFKYLSLPVELNTTLIQLVLSFIKFAVLLLRIICYLTNLYFNCTYKGCFKNYICGKQSTKQQKLCPLKICVNIRSTWTN